jgi:hypothetical protein
LDRGNFALRLRALRRHEAPLPSSDDQDKLVHRPHDGLQGGDLLDSESARWDNFENRLLCAW